MGNSAKKIEVQDLPEGYFKERLLEIAKAPTSKVWVVAKDGMIGDIALDPSAGVNKVWFNNFPCQKEYCEIEEGTNFFEYAGKCDWIVGNPPFTDFIKFLMHSPSIARKGFAYLIGHSRINQVTPKRLSILEEKGFYLSGIQICTFKAWFGRYYFLIFTRSKNDGIGYSRKNYSHEVSTPPNIACSGLEAGAAESGQVLTSPASSH